MQRGTATRSGTSSPRSTRRSGASRKSGSRPSPTASAGLRPSRPPSGARAKGVGSQSPNAPDRRRKHEGRRDQRHRGGEQQRGERVHLGRDPELDLRVDVDRQRVAGGGQEGGDDEL